MDLLHDPTSAAIAAAALLLGLYAFAAVLSSWLAGGKHRPQPPPIAATIFHQLLNLRRLHDYHTELCSKHETFRVLAPSSRNQLYTADPAVVEHVLKTSFHKYGKGTYTYLLGKDLFGEGIFVVDGEKWRQQRKMASYEFSTKVLRDYSSRTFKANAAKLASIVSNLSATRQPMDIQDLLLKSTMDSIFKIGFGVELCSLDGSNEKGSDFAKAFDDCSAQTLRRHIDVFWRLKKLLNIGSEALMKKNIKVLDNFVYDIIHAKEDIISRNQHVEERGDMLSRFLEARREDPESIPYKYLRDVILNFLIAGKDTTAGTLAWFFYMACKHPSIQEKIAREIEEATRHGGAASFKSFASCLTDDTLQKMHYLHATLSETLRLYPAVALDPKTCFSNDTLPGGFDVREGDVISYLPYSMGRMQSIWGEDALVFRPERWIGEDGKFRPESSFKFTAFQAGPRICLGKDFAYCQMKIFAAVLLHFFRFKLSDENKSVHYRIMLTLHVDDGLHVFATPRCNMEEVGNKKKPFKTMKLDP